MKKILLTLVVLAGFTLSSFAQKTKTGIFNIGLEAGLPTGAASNISSFTIGGSLKYDHPIAEKTFFTISAGYIYFPYKSDLKNALSSLGVDKSGTGFVPLKAGLKYFINDTFFGEAQVGAAISTESGGGAAFAYSPGVGFKIGRNSDVGIRYEAWTKDGSTVNQFALRLAAGF